MVLIAWAALLASALILAVAGLEACGTRRWRRRTRALVSRLEAARVPGTPLRHDARQLEGLPAPARRYFQAVLRDGQPMIAAATLEHAGSFNIGVGEDRWKPFRSRQRVVTRRPGFVWDGRIPVLPGVPVRVHDAYVAGEGVLRPALFGLFALDGRRGTGDGLARDELMRFLAEAAWYPTALLPGQGVRWEAVDADSALATLVDGAVRASLLFRFDAQGLIESVRAEARGRTVGGGIVMTPWEGHWSDYRERDGMRVPTVGEVAWLAPTGRKAYWRGRLTSVAFEFAQ